MAKVTLGSLGIQGASKDMVCQTVVQTEESAMWWFLRWHHKNGVYG